MATFNKAEFWEELNATDEAFVRRKSAIGGYGPAKQMLVREWLAQKDAARQRESALDKKNAADRAALWTQLTAIGAFLGAAAAIAELYK